MPSPTRAAIYCRVSTDEQTFNHSLEAQASTLERYASDLGLTVAGLYIDPGHSGATDERPELQRLLRDAAADHFDLVLVYRLDRLARRVQLAYNLIEALSQQRVGLKSYSEPMIDTGNPIGKAILGVMAVFAEWERDTFIQRSQHGMRKAAEKGLYTGGIVPFGYTVVDRRLAVQEEEARVVRLVYGWCADDGWSTVRIARELTALGVQTKYRKEGRGVRGKTTAEHWQTGGVLRLLKSSIYKGEPVYGKRSGTTSVNPDAKLTPTQAPAIVTAEQWARAQVQLSSNRLTAMRNAKYVYLLRGLVKCGTCGRSYIGSRNGDTSKGFYYGCGGRTIRQATPHAMRCTAPFVRGAELEAGIWAEIERVVGAPELMLQGQGERQDQAGAAEADLAGRTLADNAVRRTRLLDLYLSGDLDRGTYVERLQGLETQAAALSARLEALRDQDAQLQAREANTRTLMELAASYQGELAGMDDIQRQRVAHQFVERVLVRPDGSVDVSYTW